MGELACEMGGSQVDIMSFKVFLGEYTLRVYLEPGCGEWKASEPGLAFWRIEIM